MSEAESTPVARQEAGPERQPQKATQDYLALELRDTGSGFFWRYQWSVIHGPLQLNYGYARTVQQAERKGRKALKREARRLALRRRWRVEL